MQVSCRSEQTCRTSCFSIGRMLCHGGAPIWTALTVKTGEITGISFPTGKVGPGPIRTLMETKNFGRLLLGLFFHHHGFYYNATPEATPTRPMARPPTPKFPATDADPRSTISPARRHDPPRWGRAGPTGTCTPMWAPPEGETRGGSLFKV